MVAHFAPMSHTHPSSMSVFLKFVFMPSSVHPYRYLATLAGMQYVSMRHSTSSWMLDALLVWLVVVAAMFSPADAVAVIMWLSSDAPR